ncbi:MAG: hypothetical protein MJ112_04605 [Lachnospiraceae bacterium]|nr:hypothetical protein [Lachnospiraceae bacterium]
MAREYVYGSAARAVEPRVRREFYKEAPIQRNKQKTVHLTPLYVIILSVVVLLFMGVSMMNIHLRSEVIALRNQKGNLTGELEKVTRSNDLYYDSIMSNVDVKAIEQIAILDLGMKMAESGQIVAYSGDIEDYVKQYSDLPK